jgi:GTP pyrophosphokinase
MIIAALLHDTVEDCGVSIEEIEELFGSQVSIYVFALTSNKEEYKEAGGKAKYLAKKMWKMSDNTLVLKLADRIDNLRYADKDCKTLEHKDFVRKYYNETREIFDEICQRGYSENTKNQALIFLMSALHVELEFLRIKYLWK